MKKFIFSIVGAVMVFALVAPTAKASDDTFVRLLETYLLIKAEQLSSKSSAPAITQPFEEELGFSTRSKMVINDYLCFNYEQDTSNCAGLYFDGTTLYARVMEGGSWGAVSGATPGDRGWLADGTNNFMYPSTNASGTFYPVVLGVSATSSPATANTELYVGGGGELVVTGKAIVGIDGTGGDFVAYSDASGEYLLWDASENLLAVGGMATTSSATGNISTQGTLAVTSTSAFTGAVTLSSTLELGGNASTTGSAGIKTASITSDTGAISFGNENLSTSGTLAVTGTSAFTGNSTFSGTITVDGASTLTGNVAAGGNVAATGNVSGANGTFTGALNVDSGTLYVNNSTDRVGVGTTSPGYLLDVDGDFRVGISGKADTFFVDSTNGRVGIGTTSPGILLDVDGDFRVGESGSTSAFVVDASAGRVGIGTSTPWAMLSIGAGGSTATSTVDAGKSCYHAYTDSGQEFYWYWTGTAGSALDIATTTTSCF